MRVEKQQRISRRETKFLVCLAYLLISLMILCGCGGGGSDDDHDGDADTELVDTQSPDAQYTASVDNGSAPLSVTFDASGSTDGDGAIVL